MPRQNRKFGDWGEKQAEAFLLRRGFRIICNNYQKQCGEIDLIAEKDRVLHFIEVKTRTASSIARFGLPQEAVTSSKRRRLAATAMTYLAEFQQEGNISWQMDVISIIYHPQDRKATVSLIENAFGAEETGF